MSLADRIERLPVEEWAASAARAGRRIRRRVLRRPTAAMGTAAAVVVAMAVGANALFSQSEPHPAPLWGEAPQPMVAAHGAVRDVVPVSPPASAPTGDADRALVQSVQEGLAAGGYYDGPPDGILDDLTRDGIRAFERATGLPESGEPSLALIAAVAAEGVDIAPAAEVPGEVAAPVAPPAFAPPAFAPTVTAAASDIGVADMQRLLNERGYGPLTVDGKLGPNTRDALGKFSAEAGFGADAGMTPAVLKALAGRAG